MASPAMSASGLPGSRLEAMRAGMRMRISAIDPPRPAPVRPKGMRLYGLPAGEQTGYLCAAAALRRPLERAQERGLSGFASGRALAVVAFSLKARSAVDPLPSARVLRRWTPSN